MSVITPKLAHLAAARHQNHVRCLDEPVAHRDGGCGAHPLGKVEHLLAVVLVRHKGVLDCVEQTFFTAAMGEPVITWILREDGGVRKVAEESERRLGSKADPYRFP